MLAKLKRLNQFVRSGNQAGALAYIDQNETDTQFLQAVLIQATLAGLDVEPNEEKDSAVRT